MSRVLKTLAEMVHDKLDAGTLPREDAVQMWAGMGSGKACTACEEPIDVSQAEYEMEYDDGRPPIRFHTECHSAWDVERKPPAVTSPTASLSDASSTTTSNSSSRVNDQEQQSVGPRRRLN